MISLEHYGWNPFFQSAYTSRAASGVLPGRVVSIKGFKHHVVTEHGELEAELAGKLLFGALPEELPKVGDWVLLMRYDAAGYILETLPRINELARKAAGTKTEKQVLAANIDAALIVQGLDRDFNVMRLDRYRVQMAACNIRPVVVLNKADLVSDTTVYQAAVRKLESGVAVHICSTHTGLGMAALRDTVLQPRGTYILVGSSGVGKSSLVNALLGATTQPTGLISDVTQKGKHTTTTRDLFVLPNGSLLIDTPGMREFGVTGDEGGDADDAFPAIRRVAENCRFNDCRHLNEAGCAVIEALRQGTLDAAVYDSYSKLMKEQRRFEINVEDKKRKEKQFGKMTREAKDHRKKYKY